jgi:hypothetical protein
VIKPWEWKAEEPTRFINGKWHLLDGQGRERATIWQNTENRFTWHTWDEHGTGGPNSEENDLRRAMDACIGAIIRVGWAPGGWRFK